MRNRQATTMAEDYRIGNGEGCDQNHNDDFYPREDGGYKGEEGSDGGNGNDKEMITTNDGNYAEEE